MSGVSTSRILSCFCIAVEASLALFVVPSAGMSQENSAVESESNAPGQMEEVLVYGRIPLTQLRKQVYDAEDSYFAAFNELNSSDEFDIRCRWEAPRNIATRITQRICEARFVADLESRAVREGVSFASYAALVQQKAEQLHEEMRALVLEHPELLDTLLAFDSAREAFESERERRCAGRIFTCRR